MSCHVCEQRKPKRFCPALGEKICAVCCGTGRETTIDCPSDCAHLISARRYEQDHRPPVAPDQLPYAEKRVKRDVLAGREDAIMLFAEALVENVGVERPTDRDVLDALAAMAETYRTLQSGIYYERTPQGVLAQELYRRLTNVVAEHNREQSRKAGFGTLKEGEVFDIIVFLLQVGTQETNGRPHSRAFIDYLRAWLPPEEAAESKRIIAI